MADKKAQQDLQKGTVENLAMKTLLNLGQHRSPGIGSSTPTETSKPTFQREGRRFNTLADADINYRDGGLASTPSQDSEEMKNQLQRTQADLNLDSREIGIFRTIIDSKFSLLGTDEERLKLSQSEAVLKDLDMMASMRVRQTNIPVLKWKEHVARYVELKMNAERLKTRSPGSFGHVSSLSDYQPEDIQLATRSPKSPSLKTAFSRDQIISTLPNLISLESTNEYSSARNIIGIVIEQANKTIGNVNRNKLIELYATYVINYLHLQAPQTKSHKISTIIQNQLENANKNPEKFEEIFTRLDEYDTEYEVISPKAKIEPKKIQPKVATKPPEEVDVMPKIKDLFQIKYEKEISELKVIIDNYERLKAQYEREMERMRSNTEKLTQEKSILEKRLRDADILLQKKIDESKDYAQEHEAYNIIQKRYLELQNQLNDQVKDSKQKTKELETLKRQYESQFAIQSNACANHVKELDELRERCSNSEYHKAMHDKLLEETVALKKRIDDLHNSGITLEKEAFYNNIIKNQQEQISYAENEINKLKNSNEITEYEIKKILTTKEEYENGVSTAYKIRHR